MSGEVQQTRAMTGSHTRRVVALVVCVMVPVLLSYAIRRGFQGEMPMPDFGGIYYATRCALHGHDPFNRDAFMEELKRDGPGFWDGLLKVEKLTGSPTALVYPPTTLLAAVPLAVLPWAMAQNAFMVLSAGFLVLAALLVWNLGEEYGTCWRGLLAGFVVLNSLLIFLHGNPAGLAASFCIVAAWCFLKKRSEWAGVLLLGLSLAIKPHDAGFPWLFFLLASGALRKRALQSLAVACVVGICAVAWVTPSAPRWLGELRANVSTLSAPGHINDPGPSRLSERNFGPIIDLQSAAGVFGNDPHFYNPVSYAIGGGLILAWAVVVLRRRFTMEGGLFALAAIAVLSLLPVYHRSNDAKLLLLAIPACAMLWETDGARRWIAVGLTSAAIFVTSDFPIMCVVLLTKKVPLSASTLGGKLVLLLLQPAPVVLLATGCFYLWMFVRYKPWTDQIALLKNNVGRATEIATNQ